MTDKKYHIQKIEKEFQQRSERNSSYSVRSFARDLSIDSSTLSAILSGKRKIPKSKIEAMASKVCHKESELKAFIKSASLEHFSLKDIKSGTKQQRVTLSEEQFLKISDIHTYSLLSLIMLDNFKHDYEWMAKKLNVTTDFVKEKVETLLSLGIIEKSEDGLTRSKRRTTTTDEIASEAIMRHHIDSLELAKTKCFELHPNERYFSTLTFPADPEGVGQVKKLIMEFEDKVEAYLKTRKKTEVFKLSIQYYQATEKTK
jgi:uncharacterized protein (TIGR02147 family)